MVLSSKCFKYFVYLGGLGVAAPALAASCGDDFDTADGEVTAATTSGAGGSGSASTGSGGAAPVCAETQPGSTRGSAIALSADDGTAIVANRDVGTVSVMRVAYAEALPTMSKVAEIDLGRGSEPWQVAIDACGTRGYAVLRNAQKVVEIVGLDTDAPAKGREIAVGAEPTGIAISPNNGKLWVPNWVEGTVSVIDASSMTLARTVDLNATLAESGLLGDVGGRPALAHPRAIAITNDGDADDTDEKVFVTEWFAQRTAPEDATASNTDVNKKGLVYAIAGDTVALVDLPPVTSTGFVDHNGADTGCFPNQVGSITIEGTRAFVTSVCASPKGPLGVFQPTAPCTTDAQCGTVGGSCDVAAQKCRPNVTDVKTTTHPAVSIIDTVGSEPPITTVLDALFDAPDEASARMPHMPSDIGFFNGFAYLTASGADAVFRLSITAQGTIDPDVGSDKGEFIDLRKDAADTTIRLPIGIATAHGTRAFAFVANDGARDVTGIDFGAQAIAGLSAGTPLIVSSSPLPPGDSAEEDALRGKRFFATGLGRWSLAGQAWGSCAACHVDGLTDNVTWYFARGPRQSTSLDGSYGGPDGSDRRIFNWTAIFDETADFELNTRGVSGGVGAIVSSTTAPIAATQRIDLTAESPPQQGLQGSTADIADKDSQNAAHAHSVLDDWDEIEAWIKTVRSPRKPVGLVKADVDAGRQLFTDPLAGNCVGCHSGNKWTISSVFYPVGDEANAATASADPRSLSNISWNVDLNGFPQALFPVDPDTSLASAFMRAGAPPGAEQIQCVLRPVGTFGKSPDDVGVKELRQDMTTAAQGDAPTGRGFNPPSLLGTQIGAPFFHAGNARTLEELLDDTLFAPHHRSAIANVFVPSADQRRQLVAFMLSIDEETETVAIPQKGDKGGVLCTYP